MVLRKGPVVLEYLTFGAGIMVFKALAMIFSIHIRLFWSLMSSSVLTSIPMTLV